MAAAGPDIQLYTSHLCPWAHRAHITLSELGIKYNEQLIDLSVPRTPEYLKVNPRGMVPSLSYDGEIITESAIVAQFLADKYPSHLLPSSDSKEGALKRARINFFVDTYFSKVNPLFFKAVGNPSKETAEAAGAAFVDAISKEIDPLLGNATPFFYGSDKLTFAEALTGSFVIRIFSLIKYDMLPSSLGQQLKDKAPNFYKWSQAVIVHPSVTNIYDEEAVIKGMKSMLEKRRAA